MADGSFPGVESLTSVSIYKPTPRRLNRRLTSSDGNTVQYRELGLEEAYHTVATACEGPAPAGAPARGSRGCGLDREPGPSRRSRSRGARLLPLGDSSRRGRGRPSLHMSDLTYRSTRARTRVLTRRSCRRGEGAGGGRAAGHGTKIRQKVIEKRSKKCQREVSQREAGRPRLGLLKRLLHRMDSDS